jgi:oligopeptide transport system substrate-binding protein
VRLAILAAIASAAGCGLPDTDYFGKVPEVKDPRHLRFCNSGEPESLDPATSSSTTAMKPVYALFDGLTDFDPNGLPEPSLATHWEISEDVRRFTFHMHDKGRWSNGRPITAHDVKYQAVRTLHPSTASINATLLAEIKNATLYSGNAVRLVLRDRGRLRAGEIVEVVAVAGRPITEWRKAKEAWPDSNQRRSTRVLGLRDRGAAEADAYARVPAGEAVQVIELAGDPLAPAPDTWTYVYWSKGDGAYGWVPWGELDVEPNAEVVHRVRRVPPRQVPGLDLSASELAVTDPPGDSFEVPAADLLMLPDVLGIRVPDDHTIVFETDNPTPWFVFLSNQRCLRPTPIEAVSRRPRRWTDLEHIVTSGPFHLVEWKQRDKMVMVRAETFWNQDEVKLDKLTMYAVDDQAAAANLYFTGGCDALTTNHVPASYTRALQGRYKDFHIDPWLGIYFVLIQTEKFPNRHLRRALAFAVDRAVIPRILHGGQFPSAQYMPGTPIAELSDADLALCGVTRDTPGVASIMITGELCYVPPPGLDYDPARAREELALARQELGAAFPRQLVFKFNQGSEQHKLIAEYLQHQWQEVLGLTIVLEVQEWKTYLADTKNGQFELGRFGWIGNFPDAEGEFLPLFRCGSANNRSRYCSDDFERALAAAKPIRDRKARLRHVYEAEKILVEDAPVIPLFVYTQIHLQKPYVRDLHINLIDQPPLHEAWLDPDWKRRPAE